jgi:dihydrofolate synthase/folylpolyglutamate synthase
MEGRCQLASEYPHIVVDVAHNVASIKSLAEFVENLQITGRVIAVCGMLGDKQIAQSLVQICPIVDVWYFATIEQPRGATAQEIRNRLEQYLSSDSAASEVNLSSTVHPTVIDAFEAARETLRADDCLIVFGSFFVVSDIINLV